jgi:hypothetical protein
MRRARTCGTARPQGRLARAICSRLRGERRAGSTAVQCVLARSTRSDSCCATALVLPFRPGSNAGGLHSKQQLPLASSSGSGRHSSGSGGITDAARHSGAGGGSPLASTLSGITAVVQRGLSNAGSGVLRTLSGAGGRLSAQGSSGYERLIDSEAGWGGGSVAVDHRSPSSRLGVSSSQQPPPGQRAGPAIAAASEAATGSIGGAPGGGVRVSPSPASLMFAAELPAAESPSSRGASTMLLRPPGLARIRTQPRQPSGTGDGGGGVPAGDPAAPGSSDEQATSGGSRAWRTRLEYQADLVAAASSPVLGVRAVQRARDGRTASEPGVARWAPRGQATPFVQTPTAQDGTNR